jgi:F420 biosynthesis protein FbiB-like protein
MSINMLSLTHLIRSRRAIRRYTKEPVPLELIRELLETAIWSPSAHNRQPWRFAVLTDYADKARLANAMGERLRLDRSADQDPSPAIEQDVQRSFERITGAPVVIIVCLSMEDMDVYGDARRLSAEKTMAVQSVAMAAQSLWLLAHAAGLGCCWLCAPLFAPEVVRDVMGLSADWEPQGLLTLGWPAQTRTKSRQPLACKVHFFGNAQPPNA